jgi:hypothetical protein
MLRIYADFNSRDEQGRLTLDTVGSMRDLDAQKNELKDGMIVIFYVPDEFEVEGSLVFDRIWLGIPDLATLRYVTEP